MKAVKRNVWGNLSGYEGRRKSREFGLDAMKAADWAVEHDARTEDPEVEHWADLIRQGKYESLGRFHS